MIVIIRTSVFLAVFTLLLLSLLVNVEGAGNITPPVGSVLARYTFDGRVPMGQKMKRICSARFPYNGEDYIPNPAAGEYGPVLQNPGGGGEQLAYYRSYYNNAATESAETRQTLELELHHSWCLDSYSTHPGEVVLPVSGSFTWEIVVRIDAFDGSDHYGMLLDNSKGAGRYPNWPGEFGNRSVITRLWMIPAKDGTFQLQFTVPLDDCGRGVTISTDLAFGKWYHIAAVYDDTAHKSYLYINGKQLAEGEITSWNDRATGFCLGWFGPEVFRVDHPIRLQKALIDAIAMTKDVRRPDSFVLSL